MTLPIPSNYSGTKCPHCQKTKFETVTDTPNASSYKYTYLRCADCKTFLAAFDFLPIGDLIGKLAAKQGIKF